MANSESLESVAAAPQGEDSADLERTAAAVVLKTFGNWLLCTFVPVVPVNGRVSKVRSPANIRNASRNFLV